MQKNKLLGLLGLCRRAGRVQMGHDPVLESLRTGKARLVLLAGDLSPHTSRGLVNAAEQEGVPLYTLKDCTIDEMGAALGKRTGAAAVEDSGFAKKLKTYCTDNEEECSI